MYKYLEIVGTILVFACCSFRELLHYKKSENQHIFGPDETESCVSKFINFIDAKFVGEILLGLEFIIFIASRTFHLGIAPTGFHVDEFGMAYDAVCLANGGVDRWGHSFPVYLANYNTGQSSLYAYTAAALLKIFPFSFRLMRMPAVIYGAMAFFACYYIGKSLTKHKIGGLMASTLVVIVPYYLTSERWGLDCNLFLSLSCVAMALTIRAYDNEKIYTYILAGIAWGVSLYTYIISYLLVPLFVVVSSLLIMNNTKNETINRYDTRNNIFKLTFCKLCSFVIPVVAMGIPLMLEQLVNIGRIPEFTLFGSDYYIFSPERVHEISFNNVRNNFFVITRQLFVGDELTYNALPKFGALLMPMIPLFYYGLYLFIKRLICAIRDKSVFNGSKELLILSFFIIGYLEMLVVYKPNFNRYNELFLPILVFILMGLWDMISGKGLSEILAVISIITICACFIFFAKYYYADMNDELGEQLLFSSVEVADAISFSEKLSDKECIKQYYLEIEYDQQLVPDLLVASAGNVSQTDWLAYKNGETGNSLGRFEMHFPEQFDENKDAIYIIGNNWHHISEYMETIGFNTDRSFPNYVILYK